MKKQVLVTVGTYTFNSLLEKMDDPAMVQVLKKHGFTRLVFQCGRSTYAITHAPLHIETEVLGLTPKFEEYVLASQLIIGHGGAGTILDALKNNVSAIIVSNQGMMNNHQRELVDALVEEKAIVGFESSEQVSPQAIDEAISQIEAKVIRPLQMPADVNIFKAILDSDTYN